MHKWTFCSYIALVLTVKTTSMTFNHLKNNLILPASVALVFMQPGLKAQDKKEIGEKTEKRGPNIVYVFPDQYRKQCPAKHSFAHQLAQFDIQPHQIACGEREQWIHRNRACHGGYNRKVHDYEFAKI